MKASVFFPDVANITCLHVLLSLNENPKEPPLLCGIPVPSSDQEPFNASGGAGLGFRLGAGEWGGG